jgi:hypothetical protein
LTGISTTGSKFSRIRAASNEDGERTGTEPVAGDATPVDGDAAGGTVDVRTEAAGGATDDVRGEPQLAMTTTAASATATARRVNCTEAS